MTMAMRASNVIYCLFEILRRLPAHGRRRRREDREALELLALEFCLSRRRGANEAWSGL